MMKAVLAIVAGMFLACLPGLSYAEVGVTNTTILLGQSADFSGPAQELSVDIQMGARLYFDDINTKGGIYGRKIELYNFDDGYDAKRAEANTKELIEKNKVFALFGYVGTATSQAAIPIFTAAKVPFIAPYTGADALREPFNRHIFNVRASYKDETEKIIEQLVSVGSKKIAVVYQNNTYGKNGLDGLERALTKRGLKVAATGTLERESGDVGNTIKPILAAQPDAVVIISSYKMTAAVIKEMRKIGTSAQFFTVSYVGSRPLAWELGPHGVGVMVTQVVPFPWGGKQLIEREYQKLMNASGATEYSFTTLEGFLAAKILVEGLKRAGKDLTREKLISALESMTNIDVGGFHVNYSPTNHNASNFVDVTMITKNSQFVH